MQRSRLFNDTTTRAAAGDALHFFVTTDMIQSVAKEKLSLTLRPRQGLTTERRPPLIDPLVQSQQAGLHSVSVSQICDE